LVIKIKGKAVGGSISMSFFSKTGLIIGTFLKYFLQKQCINSNIVTNTITAARLKIQ
jgi:hypothetical protein